jgi:hypothetical protein
MSQEHFKKREDYLFYHYPVLSWDYFPLHLRYDHWSARTFRQGNKAEALEPYLSDARMHIFHFPTFLGIN